MRHILPPLFRPRATMARVDGTPPTQPPPQQPNQPANAQGQTQQNQGNRNNVVIGIIIAILLLLLLACVALAPGFLAKRNPTTNATPTPTTNPISNGGTPSPSGNQALPGLTGQYYRMPTYAAGGPVPAMPTGTPVFTAVDATIDVPVGVWGVNGSQHYPHPELGNLGPHGFAIRWTGLIQPTETATYTFYATADDSVRVWVNNQLLIDNWTIHAPQQSCSNVAAPGTPVATPSTQCNTIALTAGQLYPIQVEYYENYVGDAEIELFWQAPNMSQPQIVPASAFFHQP